jgi:hypothetical protein
MASRFDERARERFRDVERQQQREPLARAAITTQQSRRKQPERDGLQHEPRAMRRQRRENELPQRFERDQRQRPGNGGPRSGVS